MQTNKNGSKEGDELVDGWIASDGMFDHLNYINIF